MNAAQKFIVWDWNGTLLDDTDVILDCVNIALKKMECATISIETLHNTPSKSLKEFYLTLGVPEKKITPYLTEERHVFHDNYEPRADHAPLRKGARALLEKLKANNTLNFILSNHITDQIVRMLKRHDIHSFFDEVMGYASRDKQFRDITKGEKLRQYLQDKNLIASNAMIIGDTKEEIEIGHKLGISSVAITGGQIAEDHLRASKPDHVVHSLDDFYLVLQKRGFLA
jgi:phosphoglycolate phosphatase